MTERFLRRSIPVFINSFNQLSYLQTTVCWFLDHGFCNVTIVDNKSDYPPLRQYFAQPETDKYFKLIQLENNIGPRASLLHVAELVGSSSPFIFTDPDLWLPENPADDMVQFMFEIGQKYRLPKVGLALDISEPELFDPDATYKGHRPDEWEKQFWARPIEKDVYQASVDTTFFLSTAEPSVARRIDAYGLKQPRVPAARLAGQGFIAKHRPWYLNCGQTDEEKAHYRMTATSVTSWTARA